MLLLILLPNVKLLQIYRNDILTNAGVPPEDVPVKDVEGEMSEATWNLAVEVLSVKRTAGEFKHKEI